MNLHLPQSHLEILLQLFLAAALGGLIGLERQRWHKPAGFRTGSLVCLGSTLFTVLSLNPFTQFFDSGSYDPSRMISQIVVGIGFIGAGVIIHKRAHVEGVTTAAGLWVTAAIGIAIGIGYYLEAFFATFLVLMILLALGKLEVKFESKKPKK